MIPIPTASNHTVTNTIYGWLLEWVSKYPQPPHRVNNIDTEVSASCRELLSRTQEETLRKVAWMSRFGTDDVTTN